MLMQTQEDPAAILDIKEDIREECSKLGEVTNVVLFDKEPEGVASVRFGNAEAARACVRVRDSRRIRHCYASTDGAAIRRSMAGSLAGSRSKRSLRMAARSSRRVRRRMLRKMMRMMMKLRRKEDWRSLGLGSRRTERSRVGSQSPTAARVLCRQKIVCQPWKVDALDRSCWPYRLS